MTIGKVAKKAGVSVRTLRYYDEIGLVRPSGRTQAGYRSYSVQDLARLQQVRSLCKLGFSLEEVAKCLDSERFSATRLVELQLDRVEQELKSLKELRGRLRRLALHLKSEEPPQAERFLETLEAMNMLEQYYTPEQLDWLEQRHQEVGEERVKQAEAEWQELFARFAEHQKAGHATDHEEVRRLAGKAKALVGEFTGGNPEISTSLSRMYQQEGGSAVMQQHGCQVTPAVWDFMIRAMNS